MRKIEHVRIEGRLRRKVGSPNQHNRGRAAFVVIHSFASVRFKLTLYPHPNPCKTCLAYILIGFTLKVGSLGATQPRKGLFFATENSSCSVLASFLCDHWQLLPKSMSFSMPQLLFSVSGSFSMSLSRTALCLDLEEKRRSMAHFAHGTCSIAR